MVLTDMPFQHEQFLHNRYKTIQRPESVLEDKTEFSADDTKGRKDYAAFLMYVFYLVHNISVSYDVNHLLIVA